MLPLDFTCPAPKATAVASTPDPSEGGGERRRRGHATFRAITGEAGEDLLAFVGGISPRFAELVVEFPFGDLVSRPALGLREREIATVSALIALGFALPQLKLHMHGALNVGVTEEELIELVMQMSAYAGFPAALNALGVAKEVLAERAARTAAAASRRPGRAPSRVPPAGVEELTETPARIAAEKA